MKHCEQPQPRASARIKDPRVRAIVEQPPSRTDPNGSYTGRPADAREKPVQDADDL